MTPTEETKDSSSTVSSLLQTLNSFHAISRCDHVWILKLSSTISTLEKITLLKHIDQLRNWYRVVCDDQDSWLSLLLNQSLQMSHFYGIRRMVNTPLTLDMIFMMLNITQDLWAVAHLQYTPRQWSSRLRAFIEPLKIETCMNIK
jgi:hypothetical protein